MLVLEHEQGIKEIGSVILYLVSALPFYTKMHGCDLCLLCSFQGILRLRGRPTVAYDQQGLVFAVAMEGGAIKLFDSRSYDKVLTYKCIKH